jgi:hypothetical protein
MYLARWVREVRKQWNFHENNQIRLDRKIIMHAPTTLLINFAAVLVRMKQGGG